LENTSRLQRAGPIGPETRSGGDRPQPRLFAAAIDTPNTRAAYWPREKGGKLNEMPA